jgi:hypothetical protein
LKKTIVLTEMVGYNCFIIFQYYYLNIKILKFYENWNFWNFWKIWNIEFFLKILISYENFDFFLNFWNFEMFLNFWNIEIFWKFWTEFFVFFIDFIILKLYENFERVVPLLRHAMGCLPGNNRVVSRLG